MTLVTAEVQVKGGRRERMWFFINLMVEVISFVVEEVDPRLGGTVWEGVMFVLMFQSARPV